jgi:hypothetical protein
MNASRICGIYTQWKFTQPQRRMKFLSFTGKWIKLENIIISEVSQAQKAKKSHVLPHMQITDPKQIQ